MPVAFYAVVSIAVIGLYLAFAIPIWLRWRMGDALRGRAAGTTAGKYRWMNLVAVAEIVVVSIYFILPFTPGAACRSTRTSRGSSSTTPRSLTLGSLLLLAIWWSTSAKKWFTGPKHTIDEAVVEAFDD